MHPAVLMAISDFEIDIIVGEKIRYCENFFTIAYISLRNCRIP